MTSGNIFNDIQDATGEENEDFAAILTRPGLKIERIVSRGQASPPGFWYDQAWNEWVMVLTGAARLCFEDEPGERALGEGDYVFIPAGRRHRVAWTSPTEATIWLAVHFE